MNRSLLRLLATCVFALAAQPFAFAQGGATSSLSGVVVDSAGGVVPGATITVKNNATASTFETLSNSTGAFSIPVLDPGTYTVTVALSGFKTVVINDVRLLAATPGSVRAALEVGSLTDTVEVRGGTELVQTQSSTVSSTITTEQITNLPLVSRNALNFVVFLPGVETSAGPRGSTISGLPQNAISVTYDGVNVNNNFQSTDGFFSMVTPRLDAVEEVTVTGATPTADQAALGAVQVAFVTRSGTNNFDGSLYHYFRHPDLNSNYYFNKIRGLERNDVVVHQYGGRIGGPIVIPGLFDGRNKAFFFFNMEEFYQPTEASRTRTILHPRSQEGWFRYNVTVGGVQQVREVNLLTLAQQNNQLATLDPITRALLANVRAAAGTAGAITDLTNPNTQHVLLSECRHEQAACADRPSRYQRVVEPPVERVILVGPVDDLARYPQQQRCAIPRLPGIRTIALVPDGRLDQPAFHAVLEPRQRAAGGMAVVTAGVLHQRHVRHVRPAGRIRLELHRRQHVRPDVAREPHGTRGPEHDQLEHRQHDELATRRPQPQLRRLVHAGQPRANGVERGAPITFGTDTNFDPASAMFSTAALPGASTQNFTDARALYGLLTGRITAINGTARLSEATNQYEYLGPRTERVRLNELGVFAQDSWRFTPTLTLNYGVRWELQLPMQPLNDSFSMSGLADLCGRSGTGSGPGGRGCNLYQPGTLTGSTPQYVRVRQRQSRVRDRLEQLRAQCRRRVAAERAGWLAAYAAR